MDIKGTKTEKNLMDAFSGESQAHNKYSYYASKARKEGYEQIAAIIQETADNEKEHAKIWFKLLHDNQIGPTNANLLDAAGGEHYEWTEMYKNYAADARAEGFTHIATLFELVAHIEKEHEERFLALLHNLEQGKVFRRDQLQTWICSNCGHQHEGPGAPDICPACSHPQSFFEIKSTNY